MSTDFDRIIDRRPFRSIKWNAFPEDVLPLWVADMDFASPPAISEALHRAVDHNLFGYAMGSADLDRVIVERMAARYNWTIEAQDIMVLPGLVPALSAVARSVGQAGDGVLMVAPVYGPFLTVPAMSERFALSVPMHRRDSGSHTFSYEIDFDAIEAAITPQTSLFYLCNPHNPIGHAWTRSELEQLAEICLRHKLVICADEIHCDLLFEGVEHIPMASLSPEVAAQTITLMAPSKTFNMPGLGLAFAITQNEALRARLIHETERMFIYSHGMARVSSLSFDAALAAYEHGDSWLRECLQYMQGNRDYIVETVQDHMPMLQTTVPEATYLSWLDCSAVRLPEGKSATQFFLEEAKVAFSPGEFFGKEYAAYVRLNFACPRSILVKALEQMQQAVASLPTA